MKILWLTHRDPLNPKAGGAERIVYEIGTYLVSKGNEVTIVGGGWPNCKEKDYVNGMKVLRYGQRFGPHFAVPILMFRNKYDIIIADLGHAVPWISPVIFREQIIVSFLHFHARSLPGQVNKVLAFFIGALERIYFIVYHNKKFITISTTSSEDLKYLGINEDRISIINPGVNRGIFKPLKKTEFPSIVYFGGLRAYKRPNEVLYLLKELKSRIPNLQLTVIGNGPMKAKMEKTAFELGISESINFMGRLEDIEVGRIVAFSWLNIHSSTTEGWGISIIEAASAGTPTVAYEVPGVIDSIQDGINGIKVQNGNRLALVEAAYEILKSPQKWWSSSVKVAKKYSWEKASEMWEKQISVNPIKMKIIKLEHPYLK